MFTGVSFLVPGVWATLKGAQQRMTIAPESKERASDLTGLSICFLLFSALGCRRVAPRDAVYVPENNAELVHVRAKEMRGVLDCLPALVMGDAVKNQQQRSLGDLQQLAHLV